MRTQAVSFALVDVLASLALLVVFVTRLTETDRSVRRILTTLWTLQLIALLRFARSSLVTSIAAVILPVANLFQVDARVVVRTLELSVLQVTLGEAVLLVRPIAAIVDSIANPIVVLDTVLVLAQEPLALRFHIHASDGLVRSIQAVRRSIAYQVHRNAHLVRAGELELTALRRYVWHFEILAVLFVIPQRTIIVLIAEERRTDAGFVVMLAAVPHRFLTQEIITADFVAPVGTVLVSVAVVRVRDACSVVAAVLVVTARGSLPDPTGRRFATGIHATDDNGADQ